MQQPNAHSQRLMAAAQQLAIRLAKETDILAMMVAGSVAAGTATPKSDIDMIILRRGSRRHNEDEGYTTANITHNKNITIRDITLDTQTLYRDDVDAWLAFGMNRATESPSIMHMLAHGFILYDTDDIMGTLQDRANAWLDKGPVYLDSVAYGQQKNKLQHQLDNAWDADDFAALVDDVQQFLFNATGHWPCLLRDPETGGINKHAAAALPPEFMLLGVRNYKMGHDIVNQTTLFDKQTIRDVMTDIFTYIDAYRPDKNPQPAPHFIPK